MSTAVKGHVTRVGDIVAIEDRTIRRRAIGRPLLIATALELIDEEGLRACTMQALATRLGVTPRALYRHVADKDDLLRGVAQLVLAEMALPDATLAWRDRLRHAGFELRRVLRAHPHAAPLCAHRATIFPAVIPITDALIGAFADAGQPAEDAVRFGHALFNYTLGFAYAAADFDAGTTDASRVADPLRGIGRDLVPRAAAIAGFLATFANDGLFAGDEQYAFGLELLIDGLGARRVSLGAAG